MPLRVHSALRPYLSANLSPGTLLGLRQFKPEFSYLRTIEHFSTNLSHFNDAVAKQRGAHGPSRRLWPAHRMVLVRNSLDLGWPRCCAPFTPDAQYYSRSTERMGHISKRGSIDDTSRVFHSGQPDPEDFRTCSIGHFIGYDLDRRGYNTKMPHNHP